MEFVIKSKFNINPQIIFFFIILVILCISCECKEKFRECSKQDNVLECNNMHILWEKLSETLNDNDYPFNIHTVEIINSSFSATPEQIFKIFHVFPELIAINIQNVKIISSDVKSESPLDQVKHLQVLSLNEDHIGYSWIGEDAFENTSESNMTAVSINLQNNNLGSIPARIFEFFSFNSIRVVQIYFDDNLIETIQGNFLISDTLMNLSLRNNKLKIIKKDTFHGVVSLTSLDVSENQIELIEENSFKGKKNFKYFIARNNHLKKIKKGIFQGVKSLLIIDLTNNQIETIEDNSFKDQINLHLLHFSHNKIKKINHKTFQGMTFLFELDLSDNQIMIIQKNAFADQKNLQWISLANNQLKEINFQLIINHDHISYVDLSQNLIENIEDGWFKSKTLETVNLQGNRIKEIRRRTFDESHLLKEIHLGSNLIEKIEQNSFSHNIFLRALHLENNKIKTFDTTKFGYIPEQLQTLDLSMNPIGSINFIITSNSLKFLNLSHTNIKDFNNIKLTGFTVLETLDLSNSAIVNFDTNVLHPIRSLQTINISDNYINKIDYKDLKSRVKFINLTNNKWNCSYGLEMIRYLESENITVLPKSMRKRETNKNLCDDLQRQENYYQTTELPIVENSTTTESPTTIFAEPVKTMAEEKEERILLQQIGKQIYNYWLLFFTVIAVLIISTLICAVWNCFLCKRTKSGLTLDNVIYERRSLVEEHTYVEII